MPQQQILLSTGKTAVYPEMFEFGGEASAFDAFRPEDYVIEGQCVPLWKLGRIFMTGSDSRWIQIESAGKQVGRKSRQPTGSPKPHATARLHKLEIHLDGNGVDNTRRHRQSKRLALPAGIPSDTAPGSKQ
jgi:hypothetical protein